MSVNALILIDFQWFLMIFNGFRGWFSGRKVKSCCRLRLRHLLGEKTGAFLH
jgi:hypothetical protein